MDTVVVNVSYKFIDGAHIFTSDEVKWAGLFAASTDLKMAWDDVAIQLKSLAKLNHSEEAEFVPARTFPEFCAELKAALEAALAAAAEALPAAGGKGATIHPAFIPWKEGKIAA